MFRISLAVLATFDTPHSRQFDRCCFFAFSPDLTQAEDGRLARSFCAAHRIDILSHDPDVGPRGAHVHAVAATSRRFTPAGFSLRAGLQGASASMLARCELCHRTSTRSAHPILGRFHKDAQRLIDFCPSHICEFVEG
jgi:hypothetical protein